MFVYFKEPVTPPPTHIFSDLDVHLLFENYVSCSVRVYIYGDEDLESTQL